MRNALIVIHSEDVRIELEKMLKKNCQVIACSDSLIALDILKTSKPDVFVLDLELPVLDGLGLLTAAGSDVPKCTIALTSSPSNYVVQTAIELGAAFVALKPCSIQSITQHINRLCQNQSLLESQRYDPQAITAKYLIELGIPQELDGFNQLKTGIPLFAQDPSQKMLTELFPKIAELTGYNSPSQIERSIRSAIRAGLRRGNRKVWLKHYPLQPDGTFKAPTAKQFIACLAERLLENWPKKRPA